MGELQCYDGHLLAFDHAEDEDCVLMCECCCGSSESSSSSSNTISSSSQSGGGGGGNSSSSSESSSSSSLNSSSSESSSLNSSSDSSSMSSPSSVNSSSSNSSGGCTYDIEVTLFWNNTADIDLYVKNNDQAAVCYSGSPVAGGFSLNHDAHPDCDATPVAPEVISGSFDDDNNLYLIWYNQLTKCNAQTVPMVQKVKVTNTGTGVLTANYNGEIVEIDPENSDTDHWYTFTGINSAGYDNGDQSAYANGSYLFITCE